LVFQVARTVAGGSITEPRILISRSDDGKAPMARFREIKTRQKFVLAHASIHTHFDLERHLVARDDFKNCRSPALVEWREIAA
jgi:hypothetical protein